MASSMTADDQSSEDERHVLKNGSRALGLSKRYVPAWTRQEAFREFYQNWKDGIICSSQVKLRTFRPAYREDEKGIYVTMHRLWDQPVSSPDNQLLGFIRFDKKDGTLELTNFNAKITAENLELGDTTKRNKADQAGTHGEGFKVASLVMCRNGHRVQYASDNFHFTFGFRGANKANFYCTLRKAKDNEIQKQQAAYDAGLVAGKREVLQGFISRDVSVLIGKPRTNGVKIQLDDFKKWLKVTIDVNAPSDIVHTTCGDLITEQSFAGKMYLKGLLLSDESATGKVCKYSYNLFDGTTNRDRGRLIGSRQEARQIYSIWTAAIDQEGEHIVDKYVTLLQKHQNCADVSYAETMVTRDVAGRIWANLLQKAGSDGFYVSEEDHADTVDMIRISLKRRPVTLPESLCDLLLGYELIRTPQQQRIHLFRNSGPSVNHSSTFSNNVKHAFRAALALSEHTRHIETCFVQGGQVDLDLLYLPAERTLMVHEKWLDFGEIHKTAHCPLSRLPTVQPVQSEVFFCDHIVVELYGLILPEVIKGLSVTRSRSSDLERSLRSEAQEKLQQMPRGIRVSSTQRGGELEIFWLDGESALLSRYFPDAKVHVTLHREATCSGSRRDMVHQEDPQIAPPQSNEGGSLGAQTTALCGCYEQISPLKDGMTTFHGLDSQQEYFPMIARLGKSSIFGIPPAAARPESVDVAPELTPPSSISGDTMLTQDDKLALTAGYETDDSDHDSLYRAPAPLSHPRLSNGIRNHHKSNVEASVQKLAVGARPRPNSAARRSLNDNSSGGMSENTHSLGIHPTPDLRNNGIGQQRKVQQQHEARSWKTWEETMMNDCFALFTPRSLRRQVIPSLSAKHYTDRRLDYVFEEGDYVQVTLRTANLWGDSSIYILKIHSIVCPTQDEIGLGYGLIVSRYSPLLTSPLYRKCQTPSDEEASEKELVLHFESFESMGQKQDAEYLPVDDIEAVQGLDIGLDETEDPVMHVTKAPEGSHSGYFCRFAIRNYCECDSFDITPLNSHLLPFRRDHWKKPRYRHPCKPAVFDLTPNVLGTAEGFSQACFDIYAGLGFDEAHHMTWKVRHHSALVYDGSPQTILNDFTSQRLDQPSLPASDIARLVTVSGANEKFNIADPDNDEGRLLAKFLRPLEILKAAVRSPALTPDFLVLTMPCEILHEQTLGAFILTVFTLLQHRYCLHVRKVSVQECGLPQDRTVLILLASPVCAEPNWAFRSLTGDLSLNDGEKTTVKDAIEDISYHNSRELGSGETAFVCKYTPSPPAKPFSIQARTACIRANIYNHETGLAPPPHESEPIVMDSTAVSLDPRFSACLTHPTRGDVLTVREVARLQGFPDDCVFYGLDAYTQVLAAFPPPIATMVGQTILRTIYDYRLVCGDNNSSATEANVQRAKRLEAGVGGTPRAPGSISHSKRPRVEADKTSSMLFSSGRTQQNASSFTSPKDRPTPDPRPVGVVPDLAE